MVMESLANYLRCVQEHWDWKLWQLIVLPGVYQALVTLMDQHSAHRPRISSLLLMQTATRRPLSLRIGNHQFGFHQSTIRILDLDRPLPILFGCPLELCTVGELKKIPPVLEYILTSLPNANVWWADPPATYPVGQKHRNSNN